MNDSIAAALRNWIPYKLTAATDSCRWLYVGDHGFTAPFFDETILACHGLKENSSWAKPVSSLSILPEWATAIDAVPPTAFIFHVSRCGSTLVSQLLCQQPANIVLSEVPFFDTLLREGRKQNAMDEYLPLLEAAVRLYGAKRQPTNHQLFIKTDSWHIQFYKELRQLYPNTPFILLYRRPDEVLYSQQKKRGMHAVPGIIEPELLGVDTTISVLSDMDVYMGRVLTVYLKAFADILVNDSNTLAVNYSEGIMPIVNKMAAFTGIDISEAERKGMEERAGFHAKFPEQVFAEPAVKQAPPAFLEEAFKWYDKVEQLRTNPTAP